MTSLESITRAKNDGSHSVHCITVYLAVRNKVAANKKYKAKTLPHLVLVVFNGLLISDENVILAVGVGVGSVELFFILSFFLPSSLPSLIHSFIH